MSLCTYTCSITDTPPKTPPLTVGQLSRRTGVSIKNIRRFTDIGLIRTLGRSSTGYRLFTEEALWCVRWIQALRGLGLTIAEISEITAVGVDRRFGPWLAGRLRASRSRLEAQIAELEQVRDQIDDFQTVHARELTGTDDRLWDNGPTAAPQATAAEIRPEMNAVST